MKDIFRATEVLKYFNYKLCKKNSSLNFEILSYDINKVDKGTWYVSFTFYVNEKLDRIEGEIMIHSEYVEGMEWGGAFIYANESRSARRVIIKLIAQGALNIIEYVTFDEDSYVEYKDYLKYPHKQEELSFYANAILSKKY